MLGRIIAMATLGAGEQGMLGHIISMATLGAGEQGMLAVTEFITSIKSKIMEHRMYCHLHADIRSVFDCLLHTVKEIVEKSYTPGEILRGAPLRSLGCPKETGQRLHALQADLSPFWARQPALAQLSSTSRGSPPSDPLAHNQDLSTPPPWSPPHAASASPSSRLWPKKVSLVPKYVRGLAVPHGRRTAHPVCIVIVAPPALGYAAGRAEDLVVTPVVGSVS
ncbi:Calpain-5 [Platysternon megacephalum]|uniref:Calpain-5 n=1 Tax=Platysternon megacephalum TaxID=55544 RepID=A0A4D9DHR8_9SAUR|nr:Calpain-5 [Platysternon megacephalum]